MSNFYTILTNIGAALHANAQVQQTTVPWTHMALGDGNGNPVVPQQTQTGLVREVHRLPITSLEQHPDNPNWIVVEAVVPSDVGGWTVRETALYGGTGGGSCIAVGNYPATYKPVLAEGAAREMVMRMVIEVSSVATVKLLIDPAVAIASRKWVESLVATPDKAGLVKLATVDEAKQGLRDDVAVTPEGLNARMDMMDARVATLEAIPKPPGYQQVAQNITASTVTATYYPNATTRVFRISVAATAASPSTVGHVSIQRKLQDGSVHNAAVSSNADGVGVGCEALIYPGESWAVSTRLANLVSVIKTS